MVVNLLLSVDGQSVKDLVIWMDNYAANVLHVKIPLFHARHEIKPVNQRHMVHRLLNLSKICCLLI
jgi:hypothetical protein